VETAKVRIAIPHFAERIAPCFEHSATMAVFTVEDGRVVDQIDVPLQSQVAFDRVRMMRVQRIDVVICGGVEERYEDMLRGHGIEVVSWVCGEVDDLLRRYIRGRLKPGDARPEASRDD
jgi:predicted Fe-Mo cluster-binding NifX family protein